MNYFKIFVFFGLCLQVALTAEFGTVTETNLSTQDKDESNNNAEDVAPAKQRTWSVKSQFKKASRSLRRARRSVRKASRGSLAKSRKQLKKYRAKLRRARRKVKKALGVSVSHSKAQNVVGDDAVADEVVDDDDDEAADDDDEAADEMEALPERPRTECLDGVCPSRFDNGVCWDSSEPNLYKCSSVETTKTREMPESSNFHVLRNDAGQKNEVNTNWLKAKVQHCVTDVFPSFVPAYQNSEGFRQPGAPTGCTSIQKLEALKVYEIDDVLHQFVDYVVGNKSPTWLTMRDMTEKFHVGFNVCKSGKKEDYRITVTGLPKRFPLRKVLTVPSRAFDEIPHPSWEGEVPSCSSHARLDLDFSFSEWG